MIPYLNHLNVPSLKKVGTRHDLVLAIRTRPLKKANLLSVTRKFKFSNKQAARVGGMALRTFQRQKPSYSLSIPASESVLKLAEVYENGMKAFDGNEPAFMSWLKAPIPALNYTIPEEMLTSSMGADLINEELLRIEFGLFS